MTYNPNFPTASTPIPNFQQILTNWSQLNTQFGTDHAPLTEPEASKQGHHKQVFYNEPLAAPVPVPTGTQGVAFPRASVAPGPLGVTQAVYQNANGLYLLSCIKSWGYCSGAAGPATIGFNFASVTNPAIGQYIVNFSTPLPNANYAVLITSSGNNTFANTSIIGFENRTINGFQVNARSGTAPAGAIVQFSFLVLQT